VLSKAVACDAACEIAERALRLRGGPGLMMRDPVGRAFRDVQAGQVMAFSPELAGAMLGRFAFGVAPDHINALRAGVEP
jgi:alkylation response protein AidB-like acyl-CoA dehydrogenase